MSAIDMAIALRTEYGIHRPLVQRLRDAKTLVVYEGRGQIRLTGRYCYQEFAARLFYRATRNNTLKKGYELLDLLWECVVRSGSGNKTNTHAALNYRVAKDDYIVGWEIARGTYPPRPIFTHEARQQEKDLEIWSEKLEEEGKEYCYLANTFWIAATGPYCVMPQYGKRWGGSRMQCPLCGTYFSTVETPRGYRWKKIDEQHYYPRKDWYEFGRADEWYWNVCTNAGCHSLAEVFKHKKWRNPNKVFFNIFKEIIKYDLDHNPHIRRAAEDFVRHTRQIFESRSYGAGCEGDSQVIRQYLEVSGH